VEDENEEQNMSFESITNTQSTESAQSNLVFEDILEEPGIFEDSESKTCSEFPNDAYRDLMLLVTNHKLSNKAGNDIIHFFNKHSNLTTSPLPKNIEKGRAFMNNMKFSNLEFSKVLITNHGGKDYYLYYQNLIYCIKNILSVPDIIQDFALCYKNYKVNFS
jgi:hypothetical protein